MTLPRKRLVQIFTIRFRGRRTQLRTRLWRGGRGSRGGRWSTLRSSVWSGPRFAAGRDRWSGESHTGLGLLDSALRPCPHFRLPGGQAGASAAVHQDRMTWAAGSTAEMPAADSPAYMAIAPTWPVAAAPGGSP